MVNSGLSYKPEDLSLSPGHLLKRLPLAGIGGGVRDRQIPQTHWLSSLAKRMSTRLLFGVKSTGKYF